MGAAIAAAGLLMVVFGSRIPSSSTPEKNADALNQQVLDRESLVLSGLLNVGHDSGRPVNLVFCNSRGDWENLEEVAEFYRDQPTGRLVVLGAPGAGKTVLLLKLICDLAEARDALDDSSVDSKGPVPLRCHLAEWDTTLRFEEWLADAMIARFTNLTREQATSLLEKRLILPVLDGLDEMDDSAHEPVRAREAIRHLNRYLAGAEPKPLVLACREEEYQRLGTPLLDSGASVSPLRIIPLSKEDVEFYVRQELTHDTATGPLATWNRFCRASPSEAFWEAISTPWALTLLLAYLRGGGNPEALGKESSDGTNANDEHRIKVFLLSQYVPARVRGAHHDCYTIEQVERWMIHLARNVGNGLDIRLADIWRIGGSNRVRALHTGAVLIILCGLYVGIIRANDWEASYLFTGFQSSFGRLGTDRHPWATGSVPSTVLYLVYFLGFLAMVKVVLGAATASPRAPEQAITLTKMQTAEGHKKLASGLVSGPTGRLGFGFGLGAVLGLTGGPTVGILLGLLFGLAGGLVNGLVLGFETDDLSTSPVSLIYSDVLTWLVLGLVLGLVSGPTAGLLFGLAGGLLGGRSEVWMRYTSGLTVAAARGNLPVRLVCFLEWCTREGLLRRSDSTYQFPHRSIRDHLQGSH